MAYTGIMLERGAWRVLYEYNDASASASTPMIRQGLGVSVALHADWHGRCGQWTTVRQIC